MQKYCSNCGQNLNENQNFCPNCGNHINQNAKQKITQQPEKSNNGCGCLITLLIIAIIIGTIIGIIIQEKDTDTPKGENTETAFMSRSAQNSDINAETELNLSKLGTDVIITPEVDIQNLKIRLDFYTSDNQFVKSIEKYIGDVKENTKESTTVSISSFSLSETLKIAKAKIEVIGGTVYYIN